MSILRVATLADRTAIEGVMRSSARELGAAFYDARQNAGFVDHVAVLDTQLVEDGTYFVVELEGEIAACGGWSQRDKLFTGNEGVAGGARLLVPGEEPARVRAMFVGPRWARRGLGRKILDACEGAARRAGFTEVELMATLPGVPLYEKSGYLALEPFDVILPDGTPLPCLRMHKSL
jgi:GNAT superfamily N-acetyltransferase